MKVVDMHCDTFYEIMLAEDRKKELALRENNLQIDLMKMKKGDYLLQNFAMFIHKERTPDVTGTLLRMIDIFYGQMEKNSDIIAPVLTYSDIEKNQSQGKMSALLTVEEGAPCQGKVEYLRDFYRLGVRMLTLTWNFENEIGYPNTVESFPGYVKGNKYGLKKAGFEIVEEMERLGMIVDVSHLSDDGFYDVCSIAKKPFVASHSNARALSPHRRNLTDDMIRCLADHGGVTGLNFYSYFLFDNKDHSTVSRMAEHILHIANVGGIDCIGLGTDYDGIEDCTVEISDCSQMEKLSDELSRRGMSEDNIEKVFYKNVLRVYKEVLK